MNTIFLIEQNNNVKFWNLDINNIELVAGILAASIGILKDINQKIGDLSSEYYLDSNVDVSRFLILRDIPEDEIIINTPGHIIPGYYGLWMNGSKSFHYNLFTFQNNSFFQGIITICNIFNTNFRNYIYKFPFDSIGNQYTLQGYIMATKQISVDVPDIDDMIEEQRGDETFDELLHKDY